jgi:hypothetical protein
MANHQTATSLTITSEQSGMEDKPATHLAHLAFRILLLLAL